jgi:hypothetical protein
VNSKVSGTSKFHVGCKPTYNWGGPTCRTHFFVEYPRFGWRWVQRWYNHIVHGSNPIYVMEATTTLIIPIIVTLQGLRGSLEVLRPQLKSTVHTVAQTSDHCRDQCWRWVWWHSPRTSLAWVKLAYNPVIYSAILDVSLEATNIGATDLKWSWV